MWTVQGIGKDRFWEVCKRSHKRTCKTLNIMFLAWEWFLCQSLKRMLKQCLYSWIEAIHLTVCFLLVDMWKKNICFQLLSSFPQGPCRILSCNLLCYLCWFCWLSCDGWLCFWRVLCDFCKRRSTFECLGLKARWTLLSLFALEQTERA